MQMLELIAKKKAGLPLTDAEIAFLIRGVTEHRIPDEQTAAFLMAVCFNGMDERETATLTREMAESGEQLDLSPVAARTVDKHSTGGVGDKTTLILAPLVASLGGHMVKMSGRGLGHTGGTIDKLEAIPGFQVTMERAKMLEIAKRVGAVVVGQSGNLDPADKRLYALRDGTGTVESIPLIASSIMSKKIAAGCGSILLDVKVGSGAFMQTEQEALCLAVEMVKIGRNVGRETMALLTAMEEPLGNQIGNAAEVNEAVSVLKGGGPSDLCLVTEALGASLLQLSLPERYQDNRAQAEKDVHLARTDGRALAKFAEFVSAQGGDAKQATEGLPLSGCTMPLVAEKSGFVTALNGKKCGFASVLLGAGRTRPGEEIDPGAGIILCKKTGDTVQKGEVLARLYARSEALLQEGVAHLKTAYEIGSKQPAGQKLLLAAVAPDGTVTKFD